MVHAQRRPAMNESPSSENPPPMTASSAEGESSGELTPKRSKPTRRKKAGLVRWILRQKKRRYVVVAVLLTAPLVWLGTLADSLRKIGALVPEAYRRADEIAKIRTEVETQRNAVGMILRDSTSARADIDEISKLSREGKHQVDKLQAKSLEVEDVAKKANTALDGIQAVTEFTFVIARVEGDDRKAFDQLIGIATTPTHQFKGLAAGVLKKSVNQIVMDVPVKWDRLDLNPETATFTELVNGFEKAPGGFKPGVLAAIFDQARFAQFDRLKLVASVIRSTDQLSVLRRACALMNQEAKLGKNEIAYEEYLNWWYDRMGDFAGLEGGSQSAPSAPP
jgi:hypothetical protein